MCLLTYLLASPHPQGVVLQTSDQRPVQGHPRVAADLRPSAQEQQEAGKT